MLQNFSSSTMNEKFIQKFLFKKRSKYHNAQLHNHHVNAAQPAVKTVKYYHIMSFVTLDYNYPIQLWRKILKQVENILNMLDTSRNNQNKMALPRNQGQVWLEQNPNDALIGTRLMIFVY